jgi:hypothetical protein
MTLKPFEPKGLLNSPPFEMFSGDGVTRVAELINDSNKALPGEIFTTTESCTDTNGNPL